jgi:hypothetical protein
LAFNSNIASAKLGVTLFLALCFLSFKHPFYLSVTEMKYNPKEKAIETSVKIFTNDLEDALRKIHKQPVDLINGKNTEALNGYLNSYLEKHLALKINGQVQKFSFVGFEKEEEAVWIFLEYKNCPVPKKVVVENSILYDHISAQTNIVHFDLNGKKSSSKVSAPEKSLSFEF